VQEVEGAALGDPGGAGDSLVFRSGRPVRNPLWNKGIEGGGNVGPRCIIERMSSGVEDGRWEQPSDPAEDAAPSLLEADLYPDDVAAWAASTHPARVDSVLLARLRPDQLSAVGRVDALIALRRHRAFLDACQEGLLAGMLERAVDHGDRIDPSGMHWLPEEISCALSIPTHDAQAVLRAAEQLCTRLPATLALLQAGRISARHAHALAEATYALDEEKTARLEQRVLIRAVEQTYPQFRASLHREPSRGVWRLHSLEG
jgi:hypothetical protein